MAGYTEIITSGVVDIINLGPLSIGQYLVELIIVVDEVADNAFNIQAALGSSRFGFVDDIDGGDQLFDGLVPGRNTTFVVPIELLISRSTHVGIEISGFGRTVHGLCSLRVRSPV